MPDYPSHYELIYYRHVEVSNTLVISGRKEQKK